MNCPRCGNPVAARKPSCDACGCDMTVYRKIIRISNSYYNKGLEKAKVRDLSGAVIALKKSLEINKRNIDARNLLGLVYFEMGEAVAALSEWVISKHFQPDDNEADYFMERIQENPTKLDSMNQAIRKYNIALDAAKQNSDDLAIIQLKKVVSLHSNFLRAIQLLALLYIRNNDYERARKLLKRALKIDVANTTALRYMAEIDRVSSPEEQGEAPYWEREPEEGRRSEGGIRGIMPVSNYKEDKPNAMVFANLLIGVVIGIVVVYYLIVPTIKSNIREEYSSEKVDYSAELSNKSATITQQEKTIASLEKQIENLKLEMEDIQTEKIEVPVDNESYNEFFAVWKQYIELKEDVYTDDELQTLALNVWALDLSGIENENALAIVDSIKEEIYPLAARMIYKSGKQKYDEGEYDSAVGLLRAAVDFNPESDTAMYYLGKSYQAVEMYEEAVYYYKLMLEVCPNSTLKQYIPQRLRECGVTE